MLSNLSENRTSATPGNVTDKKGNFFEMIEYLPYGETLYDEAATADKTEFRFTSKEQDAETGLYYHGARYRDAITGVWLSVDPIFEMYLPMTPISNKEKEHNKKLPGLGGVFNSVNLNLCHYVGNNPIKYFDPDGNQMADPISVWGWLVRADPIAKLLNGVYQGDQRAKIALTHCFISTANDISNMGDTMMIYGIANVNPIFVISGFYISDAGEISRISLLFVLSEQTGDEADHYCPIVLVP